MIDKRKDVYRIRVELDHIQPLIWRELLVPATYSFWDLHVAIQDAMGWWDYHLHEFHVPNPHDGGTLSLGIPDDEGLFDSIEAGWEHAIVDWLPESGCRLQYDYDFGDGWTHQVTVMAIERREKGQRYPRLVAGERACPPEDCGGPWGYADLLRIISDTADAEHDSMKAWLPPNWDPEGFDPGEVTFDNPRQRWKQAFS